MPSGKVKEVAEMLKAIHAQEDLEAARGKALAVVAKLRGMILGKPAEAVESGVEETLCYMCFLRGSLAQPAHQQSARKGHPGILRRTRVVGSFPDGNNALMLVAARLRHIAGAK